MKKIDSGMVLKLLSVGLLLGGFVVDDLKNKREIREAVSDYFLENHDTDSKEN